MMMRTMFQLGFGLSLDLDLEPESEPEPDSVNDGGPMIFPQSAKSAKPGTEPGAVGGVGVGVVDEQPRMRMGRAWV
jgi:hypothetical protein